MDVFYFAIVVPLHIYFDENGQMDKREFLQLWKEIPEQNELQFSINNNKRLSAGLFFKFKTLTCSFEWLLVTFLHPGKLWVGGGVL